MRSQPTAVSGGSVGSIIAKQTIPQVFGGQPGAQPLAAGRVDQRHICGGQVDRHFERRRFELHPAIAPDAVLLGLLGREVLSARLGQPPATQPPATQPPPPSYNNCQEDPNAGAAPNYPVKIVGINDDRETVTLHNVSPAPVSLDGWIMCSIRGNQRHDGIGGTLAPGEQRTFDYTGPGNIWSNSDRDDGALYNPQGQLISYWRD